MYQLKHSYFKYLPLIRLVYYLDFDIKITYYFFNKPNILTKKKIQKKNQETYVH